MKLSKDFMKRILLIILACFVILPFVLMYFNTNVPIESFDGMADGDYNTTIEGADISGFTLTSGGNSYTGASGEAIYCIGAPVSCNDEGYTKTKVRTDALNKNIYQCISGGTDICMNTLRCEGVMGDSLDDVGERSVVEFKNSDGTKRLHQFKFENGTGVSNSSFLNNFTEPYKSTPLTIDGEFVYLYDKNTTSVDASYSACFLYDDALACTTSSSASSTPGTSGNTPIKCVAHYGTKVGERVCCGQNSIFQKHGRKCPKEYPKCVGYKCGERWGTCFEDSDSDSDSD